MYKLDETIYTRKTLFAFLEKLQSISDNSLSLYFPPSMDIADFEKIDEMTPGIDRIPEPVQSEIIKSDTGAFLLWGMENKYLIIPPFPVEQKVLLSGYQPGHLIEILKKDFTIAVLLIRLGAYAIGLFRGEQLLESKVGTGLVHSRHKKGGSSQHRYERHRGKQIEMFFSRVCQHVREKLGESIKSIDILYFGGERKTVNLFLDSCGFLRLLTDRTSPKLLNIREPRQKSLENSIYQIYGSRVIQLVESDLQ